MPIYAYKCAACGHRRDVLRKLSDPLLTECPACGAQAFAKQLTAAGFQLKGSGWYATDFKNNGDAPKPADAKPTDDKAAADKSAAEKPAAEKPAADTAAKTDAPPAAAASPAAAAPSGGKTA